jgi:hypothetical protein
MAIRTDFTAGEVLAAADLNDTFASKLNLAGGKILQIVRATDSTFRSTTSTSFVDVTGMSVTITPQLATSSILLIACVFVDATGASNDSRIGLAITDSANSAQQGPVYFGDVNTSIDIQGFQTLISWASPATASAVTYKLRFATSNASNTARVLNADRTGQLFAIEVSA